MTIILFQSLFSFAKIIASVIILANFRGECKAKGEINYTERAFLYSMIIYDGSFLIINTIYLILSCMTLRTDNIDVDHLMNA